MKSLTTRRNKKSITSAKNRFHTGASLTTTAVDTVVVVVVPGGTAPARGAIPAAAMNMRRG